MNTHTKHLIVFTLSLAVLLMSATCTSAGCLLGYSIASKADAVPSCCAAENAAWGSDSGKPLPADGKRDCPLCRHSVLIGKVTEKNPVAFNPFASAVFLLATFYDHFGAVPQGGRPASLHQAAPPSSAPSTLLALHCALLN